MEIKPVPPGNGLTAYYDAKPFFGKAGAANGIFFVNLDKLENVKKFELMALTLHETRKAISPIA